MKPTLLILAAGMGSRYGGLKQLDGLGPNGETLMDYSVYDAVRAGFGKIVFVIRHDFEDDFRRLILPKYENRVDVDVVFQAVDKIPEDIPVNTDRTKPWGTGHALLMADKAIDTPFGVINSDDFYGAESFKVLADFLRSVEGKQDEYCMVGFPVQNTLSENGTVNRGLCRVDDKNNLTDVVECKGIERKDGRLVYQDPEKGEVSFPEGTVVSMNMWGFTPDFFEHSRESFRHFLREHGMEEKSEFYIPSVVNELIKTHQSDVKVLTTPSHWFGVTYAADRPATVAAIRRLIDNGAYPESLFGEEKK